MVMHCRRDAVFLNMVFQKDFITVVLIIKEHAPCFFLKFSFSGRDPKCGSLFLFVSIMKSHFLINILFFSVLIKRSKKHIVGQFVSCPTVVPMGWGCGVFLFGFNTNSTC